MVKKLFAIGLSFLVTVGPAIVLFGSIILAIPIVNNVFNNMFFPLSIIGVFLCIPIGIVAVFALSSGMSCVGVVISNLVIFKIGNNEYWIDTNPSASATAKFGFVLSLIMFFLMIPISVFMWAISSMIILFSEKRADTIIENSSDSCKKLLIMFLVCVFGLSLSSINFGLVALQDEKYSVDKFNFQYVDFEYVGNEWVGLVGEKCQYDLTYKFQNNSSKKGGLKGSIVIENKNGVKLELKDKDLSIYSAPLYQRDFEEHLVYYYFYIPIDDAETNAMLKSKSEELRISLIVYTANWDSGIETKSRDYKRGKQIILKDFGV